MMHEYRGGKNCQKCFGHKSNMWILVQGIHDLSGIVFFQNFFFGKGGWGLRGIL
jgi:hypothetical protein